MRIGLALQDFMIRKTVQYSLSTVLSIIAAVLTLPLFFLFLLGVFAGFFVELFKFYSRLSYNDLRGYRISKQIEKDIFVRKTTKVFKLPLPEKVRTKGVFLSPITEKKLSEARWFDALAFKSCTENWISFSDYNLENKVALSIWASS